MRILRIGIEGFGGLSNDSLELAPGMTVVFGPNESAKTTLHAALYAALCGMRRARGQPRSEDREFAERHRPWGGGPWLVEAAVELADGRQIELWHDLSGRVDCRAVDVGLGRRDISAEIMFDGAPDGSRWLGFDRTSFVATACVRQSSIAAVLSNAHALQDELQRAAASAQRDETAGGAIEALRRFASEQVGLDRANATRPLRRAIVAVERAKSELETARARQQAYLDVLADVETRSRTRDEGRRRLRVAEAVVARDAAARAVASHVRARDLAARHPEEPQGAAGHGRLADDVAKALAGWERCPTEPDLSGESVEALEAALAALPERPEGDLSPAQSVIDAEALLKAAEAVLVEHRRKRPATAKRADGETDLGELDELLGVVERDVPVVDAELLERVQSLRARIGGPARGVARVPLLVAGALAVAGAALALAVSIPLGGALLALAAVIAAMALWSSRTRPDTAADEALAAAEQMLREQEIDAEAASDKRMRAVARLRELGAPDDPVLLRAFVTEARAASAVAAAHAEWEIRASELEVARAQAEAALREALRDRDAGGGEGEVGDALAAYRTSCAERERQEREASRRPVLERELAARRAAERDAAERAAARARLLEVASSLRVPEDDPERAVKRLREWQAAREQELAAHDQATKEWTELTQLVGESTVEELAVRASDLEARASQLSDGLTSAELDALDPAESAAQLDDLRAQVQKLEHAASQSLGQAEEMAAGLPSVSEAEEQLALVEGERERVRGLKDVLDQTITFLEAAQDRVHRTIAPVLEHTLRGWLPRVVVSSAPDGLRERYDDVVVDPETLRVQVRQGAGPWRHADYLSEGTKEQIFLLLRVALAEHLTRPGEKAPLILDEITAQCDAARRAALLDLLHELSCDRQIILFTHDEGALEWAEANLDLGGADAVVRREVLEAVTA